MGVVSHTAATVTRQSRQAQHRTEIHPLAVLGVRHGLDVETSSSLCLIALVSKPDG
jgi:hypothetical protein